MNSHRNLIRRNLFAAAFPSARCPELSINRQYQFTNTAIAVPCTVHLLVSRKSVLFLRLYDLVLVGHTSKDKPSAFACGSGWRTLDR